MLCSEILNLYLQPQVGRARKVKANLEEIRSSGALLRTDNRIHELTSVWFVGSGRKFHRDCMWSAQKYCPQHLFNPLVLLANRIFEATLCLPERPFATPRPAPLLRSVAASSKEASRS
jgi:hypothetical protein